ENVEQEKNSQTKRRYIKWTNDDIIILLDYIEVNYGHWMDCKREFYRFIEKNVLKHHTELEMSVKNLPYDRIHEIFGHRKREEYLKETPESLKISKSKKRILQNNGSLGDDEQE
ncbi:6357_t:CDS:2, partial [Scutellospora calospora]